MSHMTRAVICDLFGVLVTDALENIIAGMRATDPVKVREIVETITAANKGIISSEDSRNAVAKVLGITTDAYVQRIREGEIKNRQLLDYIASLRPNYKTALLSNTSSRGIEVRFMPEELAAHFDVVVASGAIGYAKPEAQAYEITADKLGVRLNECVMIDDRESYCLGAQGVGMQAILYTDFQQTKNELEGMLGAL